MIDVDSAHPEVVNRFKRIVYATGPGNVIGTYTHWRQGLDDPSQTSITYSSLFFDLCREMDLQGVMIATDLPPNSLTDGRMRIDHRRVLWDDKGGLLYHLGQINYVLGVMATALKFRADALVIANVNHWFLTSLLRLVGIEVICSVHCTLWPIMKRSKRLIPRAQNKLNGWFWRRAASATMCVSPEVERQIRNVSGTVKGPIEVFRPQYHRQEFDALAAPEINKESHFRIMYAGRVERSKGVFDILAVAGDLERTHPGLVKWEICGSGGADADLHDEVEAKGLGDVFRLRGYLNRTEMFKELDRSHALIAPTTNDFAEGLNKVAVEAILAGRPLVTTTGVPASEILGDSIILFPPGDVAACTEAVLRLATDSEFFESKSHATRQTREQFFDRNLSWSSVLKRFLLHLSRPRK